MADPASTGTESWRTYFGFDEPYENQADAVERAIEAGKARGFLAMEGPCGTGKTMAALTAGATLVRDTDLYERMVVVTPVKQQLQQFVDDLRALNAGIAEPFEGISLVGKRDLCPYGREGQFPDDVGTHDRCEDLREATARLVEDDGRSDGAAVADAAIAGEADDDQWWDPRKGQDLAAAARPDAAEQATLGEDTLSTAGAASPYRRTQPTAPEAMAEGSDPPLYCPFEADWYARNKGSPVDFSAGEEHVVTMDDYLPAATERGTCPHRVMSVMLSEADVIVGNYNHLFDPGSRPLLSDVLDDQTLVIVDEAHRLEERVRDLLSDRLGRQTIVQARNDCTTLIQRAQQSADHKAQVREVLSAREVPLDAVDQARKFYDDLVRWLDDRIESFLDAEHEGWRADPAVLPEHDREIPLRDPDTVEQDELTEWAERKGYDGSLWRSLSQVGAAVEDAIDQLGLTRQPVCAAVGVLAGQWWERDHATFLREIELEHSPNHGESLDADYQAVYTPGLVCYNCMPGTALRNVFDDLGGGILMSATLEPLDVFTRVSGLDSIAETGSTAPDEGSGDGRPVRTTTYDLPFPPENRASYLVDATPFTARNRGDPETMRPLGDNWNPTRDEYAQALRALARSPGNVMVAMPNYREARWAGAYLQDAVEKPVLVDESSSNEETERLKREFFSGDGKVIVTSTRGTLTEGVDYDGEKLSTCAVVGIPLVNIGSPRVRGVQRAYGDAFGEDNAFEYALTVPAVRRARQAIGRVIRGVDEVGVRALVGRRYTPDARHSVSPYLPAGEREEFTRMTPNFLASQLDSFWADHQ
ncbi:ATP-dependent DNA helicase [Haloarcula sp. CBA1130]|uniref:ATP-dependent DNA helicase n=1 Tax=unclassified Haloarcula TaxID=2624677 RepID=UPI0012489C5C|nr:MULTISPECIES: ATP-dependent DNA helicase [unclassified Haloarcula]KAA9397226.1 ATP-dependent DNA helicase [Haloarcula sp. CBA1129]KAA9402738.1 ATP-dependent DNA helicase [Haloarcula sp. CBA1130]